MPAQAEPLAATLKHAPFRRFLSFQEKHILCFQVNFQKGNLVRIRNLELEEAHRVSLYSLI